MASIGGGQAPGVEVSASLETHTCKMVSVQRVMVSDHASVYSARDSMYASHIMIKMTLCILMATNMEA